MFLHLLKLVWNRRRVNALLMVEIFFSFLVLSTLITMLVHLYGLYGQPLGYDYRGLLRLNVDMQLTTDDVWTAEQLETLRQVVLAVEGMDEVTEVGAALLGPLSFGSSTFSTASRGRNIQIRREEVTPGFADVLGLNVVHGRWFGPEDRGLNWLPVVVNRKLSAELFGNDDPLGKNIAPERSQQEFRIIGVVDHYRPDGEYRTEPYFMFRPIDLEGTTDRPPRNLLIRTRGEATFAFEQRLRERVQATARDWSFEIDRLEDVHSSQLRLTLLPAIIFGVVVGFMMLMVGLGLAGVLWQSVTARVGELGLRRAVGGHAGDIRTQILGEIAIMTTLSVVAGTVVFLQAPLLGLFALPLKTYLLGWLVSVGTLYGFILLCALYPSRLATSVHPAEALHYE